jgi:hypothetical protein
MSGCPDGLKHFDQIGMRDELSKNGGFTKKSSGDQWMMRVQRGMFQGILKENPHKRETLLSLDNLLSAA